jgi:hypothetical protein
MHKFFTLALVSIPLFASIPTFGALDDTQILDQENTTVSDINLKSFSSCEAMDTVLTKYFKQNLIDQVNMYGGSVGKPVLME